jgi:crossover junction endodeoxyribonuclease RuvC|tara:strand:+ start:4814 stop:5311 length:498 start_codon:yes stop_codon:yes gene_type:complete
MQSVDPYDIVRVIGIDPGTVAMGYGIIDWDGQNFDYVESGVILPKESDSLPLRLHAIHQEITDIIDRCLPSELAVEDPFVGNNVRSAFAIGQAQSLAFIAAARVGIGVWRYSPTTIKQSVTDYGRSSKDQVKEMVLSLLQMELVTNRDDEADALAVALCHIQHRS